MMFGFILLCLESCASGLQGCKSFIISGKSSSIKSKRRLTFNLKLI